MEPDSRVSIVGRSPVGVAKRFREYDQDQQFLLPPSLDEWLPADDEARFISETVDTVLDLGPVYASYESAKGQPPYDPAMMLKVLLYGYSIGVTSSREIERRCVRDIAFRWLTGNQAPDYRSLARFRRRHLDVMKDLFTQVLAVCARAGLVRMGRVALDGTKVKAAASKHKAMSYDRLGPKIEALRGEVDELLARAEAADEAEDDEFGADRRGDEVPVELATREKRIARMRAAKRELEDDAARKAAAKARGKAAAKGHGEPEQEQAGVDAAGRAVVEAKAQRNFTDPDSRIMKTNHGFEYAYNAQTIVDEASQVIIATDVVQDATDVQQLQPMRETMTCQLRAGGIDSDPVVFLADAGYCSNENLAATQTFPGTWLIATGRERSGETFPDAALPLPQGATLRQQMAHRLRQPDERAHYARRKAIVEPVFGQMKTRQNAGRFRLRGLDNVRSEWMLHTLCHNLRKLRTALTTQAVAG